MPVERPGHLALLIGMLIRNYAPTLREAERGA
jgi:hypothetical protein